LIGGNFGGEYAVRKFNSSGDSLWFSYSYINGGCCGGAYDIEVDKYGNTYATGKSYAGSLYMEDYLTTKYDTAGNRLWAKSFQWGGDNDDLAKSIEMDSEGNLYITGELTTGLAHCFPFNCLNYGTLKYNNDGALLWFKIWSIQENIHSEANKLVLDKSNNIYVTGKTEVGGGVNIGTIKYSQTTSITKIESRLPDKFSLQQNFPNPFNIVTRINFSIPKSSFIKLNIYDALGREIMVIIKEFLTAGDYYVSADLSEMTSGVFFYRITSEDFSDTKKMILIK
jgi:hypothetical protein